MQNEKWVQMMSFSSFEWLLSKKHLERAASLLYLLAVVFFIYKIFVGRTYIEESIASFVFVEFKTPNEILSPFILPVLFCVLIIDSYLYGLSRKRIFFAIVGSLIIQCLTLGYYSTQYIWLFWIIAAYPQNLETRAVLKCIWVSNSCFILFTLLLFLLGCSPDIMTYEHGTLRHSLGFLVPNAFGISVGFTILIWCLYKADNWKFWYILPTLGLMLVVFSVCDSRGSMLVVALFVTILSLRELIGVFKAFKHALDKAIHFLSCVAFPICAIATLSITAFFSYHTDNPLFDTLRSISSGRLGFWTYYYDLYGYQLFGAPLKTITVKESVATGAQWMGLDSAYLTCAITGGIVILFCLIALFCFIAVQNMKEKKSFVLALYIISFSIWCLTENIMLDIASNALLVFVGAAIVRHDKSICRREVLPKLSSKK